MGKKISELNKLTTLTGNELIPVASNGENYTVTPNQVKEGLASEDWVESKNYLTETSLAGYATESFVTTQGYLKDVPAEYAKTSDVEAKIANAKSEIIGGASTAYDTLKEIEDYIKKDGEAAAALNQEIANKANASDLTAHIDNTTVHVTAADKANWNGKTSNTGTVTQVKVGTTPYDPTSGVVSLPPYPTVLTDTNQLTNGAGFITSSGSITGNAATATKLGTTDVGSSTQPIYLKAGAPTTCGSSLAVSITGSSASCTGNAATATTATNATQLGGVAAANYLQSSTASSTYLTKTDAANTYQPKGSYLTSHQDISGKADKASVTQGSTGNATATSGATISVPYVNVNSQGIVTGYGNRTHTVTGFTNNAGTVTSVSGAAASGSNLTLTGTVTSSGSLTVGVASGYSVPTTANQNNWNDSYSFLFGHNTAASVANIPVTKRLVIATVSGADSFSLASTPASGREIHVIINNSSSSDITITIPNAGSYKSAIGTELSIKGSSYGEVNVISDGTNMYVRGV